MPPTRAPAPSPEEFDGLLGAAGHGDPVASTELFRWLAPPVTGYLRARGADDPEDLANEVFLRVFRILHTFRGGPDRFRSWVFTIARNCLIDERRRRDRRPTIVLVDDELDVAGDDDPESAALATLAHERVAALLDRLSPDQRDTLLLRIVADLSVAQTAAVLDKTVEAVKALTRRGLAALAREIQRQGVSR